MEDIRATGSRSQQLREGATSLVKEVGEDLRLIEGMIHMLNKSREPTPRDRELRMRLMDLMDQYHEYLSPLQRHVLKTMKKRSGKEEEVREEEDGMDEMDQMDQSVAGEFEERLVLASEDEEEGVYEVQQEELEEGEWMEEDEDIEYKDQRISVMSEQTS
ncbi:hypothetical protein AMATHDRAFT_7641 [Amanita thiersii Skay4041]|uniref:Uncharacterized protein n=1 Tax=Amanita thiersii Skay4041 TaxID=703135 RepID=A0A2A9NFZ9_9AGAR|nr:hypothetical protein AMATHDRAFT_7641 [Amanita thiersii Skay4041]